MQKIKRFWWVGAIIILLPLIAHYALIFAWTSDINRLDLEHEWQVELPQNGQLVYRAYSYQRIMIGPADLKMTLTWTKPDGNSHEYVISTAGSDFHDLELRLHNDHRAVWLIANEPRKTVAVLDLTNGHYDSALGVVMFWGEGGYSESAQPKIPAWATLNNGKSLGRKKFE